MYSVESFSNHYFHSGVRAKQEQAVRNIKVVLSLNRYARRDMLRALDTHPSLLKSLYQSLTENITPVSESGPFGTLTFIRHIDAEGYLIHLEVG